MTQELENCYTENNKINLRISEVEGFLLNILDERDIPKDKNIRNIKL